MLLLKLSPSGAHNSMQMRYDANHLLLLLLLHARCTNCQLEMHRLQIFCQYAACKLLMPIAPVSCEAYHVMLRAT